MLIQEILNKTLVESRMNYFPDVDNIKFDPDRATATDIQLDLMPLIVKLAYVQLMDDKNRYESTHTHPEDEEFKLSTEALIENVYTTVDHIIDKFKSVSDSDIKEIINQVKSQFKTPLID